jgi:hypothetical protein
MSNSSSGAFQTYDLSAGTKLDVEDQIWLISPFDVPLQGGMGADGMSALAHGTCFEKKVEWLDETLLTPKSTLQATLTTTTITAVVVAAGTGVNFQTGDVLLIGSEQLYVSGYGTTVDWLLVTRGFNSTTPATAAINAAVLGLGSALAEGSAPPAARAVDRVDRVNYTQIFGPIEVSVSGTEQVVQKYGLVGTEFDHQVANRTKEAFIGIEQAIINGISNAGSASTGRTMAGLTAWITSNVDSSTTSLSDSAIITQMQACYDAGGSPDRLVLGSKQKRVLSYDLQNQIRYTQDETTRGQRVEAFDTDFGRLTVCLDRWVLLNQAFLFAREQAEITTLRPMTFEMLAKTGDSTQGMIVAEKTLKFRRQSHAAMFTALT